nr:hypothetical protein [uncultured Mediterranean phage uvMED]
MKPYPANLWLTYRTVRYRPAALVMFVAKGGWGPEYVSKIEKTPSSDGRALSRTNPEN